MSKIINTEEKDGKFIITLDESIFRLAGGGQPSDKGFLKNEKQVKVLEAISENQVLTDELIEGEVEQVLNENRRLKLTKAHTAEHILFKAIQKQCEDLELVKIDLHEDECHIYVTSNELDFEKILDAELLANDIIKQSLPIEEYNISKDQAEEELRIKKDRIISEEVRVIHVKDFDKSACKGTHLKNTSELNFIFITRLRKDKGQFIVSFVTDNLKPVFELAHAMQATQDILGVEREKILPTLTNLKDNFEKYKKLARERPLEVKHENLKGLNFYYGIFDEAERKQLNDKANELKKENTLICFINKTEKLPQVMIFSESNIEAGPLVKEIAEKFNGAGGGKKEYGMASFDAEPEKVIEYIKQKLNS